MNAVQQRGSEILKRLPAHKVVGAEIGVWDGRLSQFLLDSRPDLKLYMVDRWQSVADSHRYRQSGSTMAQSTVAEFAAVREKAMRVVGRFPGRAYPLQGESVEVAADMPNGSLDFAFIDADHSYESVKEDLAAWFPKLKNDGVLCGHDWDHPDHVEKWGVREAVEEFFSPMNVQIETGMNRTWFVKL